MTYSTFPTLRVATLSAMLTLLHLSVFAQNQDCATAAEVCTDAPINYTSPNSGTNDFANPGNQDGCLAGEHRSSWYTFTFPADMPPNSSLEFTVGPSGGSADYDFALWGPNVACGSLGAPVRCNFSGQQTAGMSSTDMSSGFTPPLTVQPGQTYYLLIDNFSGNSTGFSLTWGGSAAPFLNCTPCDISVAPSAPINVCPNEPPFLLSPNVMGMTGTETFTWTATGGGVGFLDNPSTLQPTVSLPFGFSGSITYTLTVAGATCNAIGTFTVNVTPLPAPVISGNTNLCEGSTTTISAGAAWATYNWSTGSTGPNTTISAPGVYSVTVTNAAGCEGTATVNVTQTPAPMPTITGNLNICAGTPTALSAGAGYSSYMWSTGSTAQTIVANAPGVYSVTVTNNGCPGTASVTVNVSAPPSPIISGETSFCAGSSTTLFGNNGFVSYSWSNGSIDQVTTVSSPGTYTLTVFDNNGCMGTTSVNVTQAPPAVPIISGNLNICAGSATVLNAGNGFTDYLWSTGEDSQNIIVDATGTYTVTVTNAAGCIGIGNVAVNPAPPPPVNITGTPSVCPNGGTTILSASGGFSSYEWSNGSTSQATTINAPGNYTVMATNSAGCVGTSSVIVTLNNEPVPVIAGNTNICAGQSTTLSAGAFTSYNWSTGSSNPTISVNAPGDYDVTVTNAAGCTGSATVTVSQSPTPMPTITGNNTICAGESTTLNAGAGFSTYAWTGGSTSQQITVSATGTYTVTVTNAAGCPGTASFVVTQSSSLSPTITGNLSFCEGATTTLGLSGTFSTYAWSNSTSGSSINVGAPGTYSVTVTSAGGCTGSTSVVVNEVQNPTPAISGDLDFCAGLSTQLNAGAGYASYLWSNGQTGQFSTIATPGNQSVTVTNAAGCQGIATASVIQNPNPTPAISGTLAICPNGGSTTLQVTGGPFSSYQWASGAMTPTITASTLGAFSVTVTDGNGCIGNTQAQVTALPVPTPTISGTTSICQGANTMLDAGNGYSNYMWSTGSSNQNITASNAGNYTVTVTNASGCTGSTSVNLTVNALPTVAISGDLDFCAGQSSQLDAGAGFSNYSWSNSQSGQFNTVSSAGNFTVTVTDGNGCQNTATATVVQFALPSAQIAGSLSFCTDGSTTLSASGANLAAYQWSNIATTPSINVSQPGNYGLTVTDINGCVNNSAVDVEELTELTPAVTGNLNFCEGDNTLLDAGTGYTSYLWSDGSAGSQLMVSASGTYTVMVSNADGCSGETSVTVVEQALPVVNITGANSFCAGATAQLDAGAGFSTYQWTGGTATQMLTVSNAGNYSVTVTDANGCANSTMFNIAQTPLPTPAISGDPGFCPGQSATFAANAGYQTYLWNTSDNTASISTNTAGNFSVTVTDAQGCMGNTSVQIEAYATTVPVISGALNYCPGIGTSLSASGGFSTYAWTGGAASQSININQPGDYMVVATDGNGCQTTATATVTEFIVVAPAISGTAEFCAGANTLVTAQSGYASYLWSEGTMSDALQVTSGGNYTVTATDLNGCLSTASIAVTENPLPVAGISGDLDYCVGNSTTLSSNGIFPVYQWTGGATAQTLTVSAPGAYHLTVTDANGCVGTTSVTVLENPLPQPQILGANALCTGNTASLSANAVYTNYLWSDGSSGNSITVAAGGNYTLMVTDANGCMNMTNATVVENPLPQFTITGDLDFCENLNTTLAVSPAYPAYQWSDNSNGASLLVSSSGNYTVTVTDANGCQNSNMVAVTELPLPQVAIAGTLHFCEGSNTVLSASAGLASYAWSGGQNTPTITVNVANQYTVTGTDINGCQSSAMVSVIEADLPVALIAPAISLDCALRSTTLNGGGSSQGSGFTYTWNGPDIQPSDVNSIAPEVGVAGTYTLTVSDNIYQCPSATASIDVIDLAYEPIASFLVTDVLDCNTPSVTLNGSASQSGAGIVYRWYDANGTLLPSTVANYQANQAGMYTLEVFDNLTQCSATTSALVTSDFNAPTANAGQPRHLDCRTTQSLLDGNASSLGTQFSYGWTTSAGGNILQGQNTTTPNINAPGTYTLLVTNTGNGCTATASVQVTQNIQQPTANAGQDQTLNCNASLVTLDGTNSFAAQPLYRWVAQGTTDTVAYTPTLDAVAAGNFILWIIDNQNGCASSDLAVVILDNAIVENALISTEQPTCFSDANGSLTVETVEGGTPPFVYSLNGGAFSSQSIFRNLTSGNYTLVVQDAMGCEYETEALVETSNDLRVDAGPDQYIKWGDTVQVQAEVNIPQAELNALRWQSFGNLPCNDCPELILGPLQTTAYTVSVTDENGCIATDEVTIFVNREREVFIPNAFSPDGDGNNDVLMIFTGRDVVSVKSFLIFNRWGEITFEAYNFQANDPQYGWNGTSRNGLLHNTAVFVYLAEVEFLDGSTVLFKGDVTLMR